MRQPWALRGRWYRALIGVGIVFVALPTSMASASISASQSGPAASIAGDGNLQNQQWVTVNWAGYTPTGASVDYSPYEHIDDVALFECVADPPGGEWNYFRDCYTEAPPNGSYPGDGNAVDPPWNSQTSAGGTEGLTAENGTGSIPFEIQEGTLQTYVGTTIPSLSCDPSQPGGPPPKGPCMPDFTIQCDAADPCVLKVVDLSALFWKVWFHGKKGYQIPRAPNFPLPSPPPPGTWTQVVDAAPSIPINFGPPPNCPPPSTLTANVSMEGAPSASYAVQAWATGLCNGSEPLVVNYSPLVENLAKQDLLSAATDAALASIAPPQDPSVVAAPLDISGVSIVFNVADANTDQPDLQMRLTPRLAAMIITNSVDNNIGNPATAGQVLFNDPEFEALNPGFHQPASGLSDPVLVAGTRDDASIITRWIADDYDARRFLAGQDPCAHIDPYWLHASYPTDQFLNYASPVPYPQEADAYNPVLVNQLVAQDVAYDTPSGNFPGEGVLPPQRLSPQHPSQYGIVGVVDSATANDSDLPSAELDAASPDASQLSSFVTIDPATQACTPRQLPSIVGFVGPTDAGLDAGVAAMTPGPDETLNPPVTTTDRSAYPLTKVDYAFVPSNGLDQATAADISRFIRYAAGPGQSPSVLPPAYPPLTAGLASQSRAAASRIAAERGPAHSGPPTTDGSGTPPGSSAPSTSSASPRGSSTSAAGAAGGSTPAAPPATSLSARSPSRAGLPLGPSAAAAPQGATNAEDSAQAEGPVDASAATLVTGALLIPLLVGVALASGIVAGLLYRRSRRGASVTT